MTPSDHLSDEQLADLARLADGTLPDDRRAEVEAAVAASPELARVFAGQAVAMEALRGTTAIGAPARLRAGIERRGSARAPRRRWSLSPRTAVAGTAVAATLAAVLLLPAALSGSLTVEDAAAFAEKQPTGAAPAGVPGTPLLQESVGGVPFPDFAAKFGWKPVGVRHDKSHGRSTTTVYYEKGNRRMAYTIVAGDPLGKPGDARVVTRPDETYRVFRSDERSVVTWERGGHTCVLSIDRASAAELVTLADWRGKGAIPF